MTGPPTFTDFIGLINRILDVVRRRCFSPTNPSRNFWLRNTHQAGPRRSIRSLLSVGIRIWEMVIVFLTGLGGEVIIDKILAEPDNKHAEVRRVAVQVLGSLGASLDPNALREVIGRLRDREARVRWTAADVLGSFGPSARCRGAGGDRRVGARQAARGSPSRGRSAGIPRPSPRYQGAKRFEFPHQ